MTRYIIYLIIIAVVLWKGKPYIRGAILKWKEKREHKPVENVNSDLVYVPVISSRVFTFAIEIKEIGNGKATISVVKNIDKID